LKELSSHKISRREKVLDPPLTGSALDRSKWLQPRGFHKWGYPKIDGQMVFKGKSHENERFRGISILGNLQITRREQIM